MNVQDYNISRTPSYSLLSSLDKGAFRYVEAYVSNESLEEFREKPTKAQTIGSYTDALLFHDEDYISEKFYVITHTFSEGMYTKFISSLIESITTDEGLRETVPAHLNEFITFFEHTVLTQHSEMVNIAHRSAGFKIPLPTVLLKVRKDYMGYFYDMFMAEGKEVISLNDSALANGCANALKNNEYTKAYFEADRERVYITQEPILFRLTIPGLAEPVQMKALPDIIEVNSRLKMVRGVDVKTTDNSALFFRYDFFKWRYYLQSALYTKAIHEWLKAKQAEGLYEGYNVNGEFRFLVGSLKFQNTCIYQCTKQDINLGLSGFTKSDGSFVRGVYNLVEDLRWHQYNHRWDLPRSVIDNGGVIELDLLDKL